MRCLILLLLFSATITVDAAALKPIKVDGDRLVAGGKPIVLRGINWGWWHLKATKYTENDMRRQSEWGANVLRLAFSYGDVEDSAHPGMLREDGVKDVDEVLSWAEKYGQYVILDMHVCPGGQDPAGYCDGGRNLLWKDASCRARYLSLWRELAKRYRNRPALAAYELLNEPCSHVSGKISCHKSAPWLKVLGKDGIGS